VSQNDVSGIMERQPLFHNCYRFKLPHPSQVSDSKCQGHYFLALVTIGKVIHHPELTYIQDAKEKLEKICWDWVSPSISLSSFSK